MIQYLFGDDTFTAKKSITEFAGTLKAAIRWANKEDISESGGVQALFDSAQGSLLGSVVVVLQDPSSYSEDVRESILSHIETKPSGNIVLWDRAVDKRLAFHKKIKRLAQASNEFAQPAMEESMVQWARAYAPGVPVSALQELVVRTGCDVWAVVNELHKLTVLDGPITPTLVQEHVAEREGSATSAFPLLDAIVRKNQKLASALLQEMFDSGASEHFVLAMLAYQFRLFLSVRMGKDRGESVSTIHEKTLFHSIAIQKAMPAVARLSVPAITDLLSRVAAAEKSLITTTMDDRSIVTMLVIGLCR